FDNILLRPSTWYKEKGIQLILGESVTSIDTKNKNLTTSKNQQIQFSSLVFATGSSAFIPPVEGNDLEGVFVYRTYKDVNKISEFASKSRVAVVVGGGLLGLEAAEFLKDLGLKTHIIEQAEYLMPRQLDISGSQLLMNKVKNKGYELHTGVLLEKISREGNNSLNVSLQNGESISSDILIFATGVRANSDLARDAGITCSSSKGIIVDNTLQTSEKDIYAIGECIRHNGQQYGLVAPGYEMARILAERFSGLDSEFTEADMSTRLKMLGEDVVSLGDALQPYKSFTFRDDNSYRKIVHFENTIVGAIGVGEWLQSGQIQTAIQNSMPLNEKEISQFIKTGSLWKEELLDIKKWPDETLICNCMKISKGQIISEINNGNTEFEQIKKCTGASTVCGSCEPLVKELCGQKVEPRNKPEKTLLVFSFITLAAVLALVFTPVIWGGDSLSSDQYKITKFLTDSTVRMTSGFTLLGLTVLATLLSLRKRWKRLQFGKYKTWRLIHAAIGFFSIVILMAHSGFSAGKNINFMLFTLFSIINLFGFITGFASAFEFFGMNRLSAFCRRWKPQITFIHILAFWPLPVLLVFHIIQAFYFG
ncbi:MAG: FAD-dependent oxidoreductase, partial [Lentisphaeraceae bacterium]|nr:FAD-dependent oxidoreductase [Lentisphaeraceae bacterium]